MKNSTVFLIISRSVLLTTRNVSDKKCRENQNTHFMFSNFFFKSCRLWDNVEKYSRAGQANNDNTAHALCVLDDEGLKRTPRTCSTYSFSTTMVACLVKKSPFVLFNQAFVFCGSQERLTILLLRRGSGFSYAWCVTWRHTAGCHNSHAVLYGSFNRYFYSYSKKVKSFLSPSLL